MFTMIQCPKCHRSYDNAVTNCDPADGGCGWIVPQEAPAPTETDLELESEQNAIDGGKTSG